MADLKSIDTLRANLDNGISGSSPNASITGAVTNSILRDSMDTVAGFASGFSFVAKKDGNPKAGEFSWNNSNVNGATTLLISKTESYGGDIGFFLERLRNNFIFYYKDDQGKFAFYSVQNVSDQGTYYSLSVTNNTGSDDVFLADERRLVNITFVNARADLNYQPLNVTEAGFSSANMEYLERKDETGADEVHVRGKLTSTAITLLGNPVMNLPQTPTDNFYFTGAVIKAGGTVVQNMAVFLIHKVSSKLVILNAGTVINDEIYLDFKYRY
jgi:hypothetical protein